MVEKEQKQTQGWRDRRESSLEAIRLLRPKRSQAQSPTTFAARQAPPPPRSPGPRAGPSFSPLPRPPGRAGLIGGPDRCAGGGGGAAPVLETSLDETHPLSSSLHTGLLRRGKGLLCRDVTRRQGNQPADLVIGGGGGGRRVGADWLQCGEGLGGGGRASRELIGGCGSGGVGVGGAWPAAPRPQRPCFVSGSGRGCSHECWKVSRQGSGSAAGRLKK